MCKFSVKVVLILLLPRCFASPPKPPDRSPASNNNYRLALHAKKRSMASTKVSPNLYMPSIPSTKILPQSSSGISRSSAHAPEVVDQLINTQQLPFGTNPRSSPQSANHLIADLITIETLQAHIGYLLHAQIPKFDERVVARLASE